LGAIEETILDKETGEPSVYFKDCDLMVLAYFRWNPRPYEARAINPLEDWLDSKVYSAKVRKTLLSTFIP
jgi:hypothetical protein